MNISKQQGCASKRRSNYIYKCLRILRDEGYISRREYEEAVYNEKKCYWFPTLSTHFTEYPQDTEMPRKHS